MNAGPVSRRGFLAATGAGVTLAIGQAKAATAGRLDVVDLKVATLTAPLGLEDRRPALSWRVEGPDGTLQTKHRIRVASSRGLLAAGRADLWDSGWRDVPDQLSATYDGQPLGSRQRCFWSVEIRDQQGRGRTSDIASWEMGLLDAKDWSATWIAVEDAIERDDRLDPPVWTSGKVAANGSRYFRLPFVSEGGKALITLTVDGVLKSVAFDGRAQPLPTDDPHAFGGTPAARYELTMSAGRHVLAVEVGALQGYFTKPEVRLAAQVRMTSERTVKRVSSGWQSTDAKPTDWQAVGSATAGWTSAPAASTQSIFPWPPTPSRLLRRAFRLDEKPELARIYIAALGGFDLWVNGKRVDETALQPEQSDYAHHIPYRVINVSSLVHRGENVIAAMVGDGNYAGRTAPAGRYAFGPAPRRFLLQLETVAGGRRATVRSDLEWRSTTSSLRYSEIYGGEDWDFFYDQPGFAEAGFDDASWAPVWSAPRPEAPLVARVVPPIRVTREIPPVDIRRVADDRHIIDFGQNFAGRVRLILPADTKGAVRVRHAEVLTPNGELDRRNLRAARAEDNYRLTGKGNATLEPRLTYQGFRYAEVTGPRTLDRPRVSGLVMSSALEETGTLIVEQPLIQKIWSNTLWSQRSNFMGVPTDCPQRDERLGWLGDAQVFWGTAAYNMDVGAFTREWLRDVRAMQSSQGGYPVWAPVPAESSWLPQPTPGWADAGVVLPYVAYLHYGDRAVVDENWTAMRRYVDGVLQRNPDGIWAKERGTDFGDWLSVDAKTPGDETTPKALVATAMLARSVAQLIAMADWTGRTVDAVELRRAHALIRTSFVRSFVSADGRVGNGSQASYIFALALDLLPETARAEAASLLVADIRRRGNLLSTGFLATPLALDALADAGHGAVAYDLLLRTAYPSWGYMISKGATTMWERWNGDTGDLAMNSFNHYAFGAVAGFLYGRMAGIQPLEPGFAKVRIAPVIDPRTGRVRCRYDSVRGAIGVDIRPAPGSASVDLDVPPGMDVEFVAPRGMQVTVAGSMSHARPPGDAVGASMKLPSGRHSLRLTN